jgi:Dcp1-like decapping family
MNQRKQTHSRRQASVDYPRYPPQSAAQPQFQQNNPPVSDYESDTPAYLSDYPTKPPPATRTNDELNLSVIKRYNPEVVSILSIAPYSVIYDFAPLPEPAWSKTGIEGSLFICELKPGVYGEDRYIALVLNRRGLDNFEAELREGDNAGVEFADPFVIVSFKDGHAQKINGIFIFSEGVGTSTEQTRTLNVELMKQLAIQSGLSRKAAEAAAAQATANHTIGHMREAESAVDSAQAGAPMDRQISLQELFGQQRADDASWSVRVHSADGVSQQRPPMPFDGSMDSRSGPQPSLPQQNVLGDLFRRAGVGVKEAL